MMAKQDNFDFDTESKPKFSLDLNFKFIEKFTESQKKLLVISAIIVVAVILVTMIVWIIAANGGFNTPNDVGNIGGGTSQDGENGEEGNEGNGGANGGALPEYGEVTNFYISSEPIKTTYYVGDEAVYTGLCVHFRTENVGSREVYYEDSPEDFKITGFDSSVPVNSQTITVEYAGQSATFTVKILEIPVVLPDLESIRLDPAPPVEVPYGYPPDVTNSNIVCEYSDGTTKIVPLEYENLASYEEEILAANPGDQVTIKVVYTERGITCETEFTVTITE